MKGKDLNQENELKAMSQKSVGTFFFPQVVEFKEFQNQQARHCEKLQSISKLDSLGPVAVKSIDYEVKLPVPYANLAIPSQYRLNEYKMHVENSYVPKQESRVLKLRVGAEDELTQIDTTVVSNNLDSYSNLLPKTESKQQQLKESTTKPTVSKKTAVAKQSNLKHQASTKPIESTSTAIATESNNTNKQLVAPEIIDLKPSRELYEPNHMIQCIFS